LLQQIGRELQSTQNIPISLPDNVPKPVWGKKASSKANARLLTGPEMAAKEAEQRERDERHKKVEAAKIAHLQALETLEGHTGTQDDPYIVLETPPKTMVLVDRTPTKAGSSKEARPASPKGLSEELPASIAPPRLESTSKRKRRSTVKAQEGQEQARSGPGRRKK
jgi:hypothetical protein